MRTKTRSCVKCWFARGITILILAFILSLTGSWSTTPDTITTGNGVEFKPSLAFAAQPPANDLSHRWIIFLGGINSSSSEDSPIDGAFDTIEESLEDFIDPEQFVYFSYSAMNNWPDFVPIRCGGWGVVDGTTVSNCDTSLDLIELHDNPVYTDDDTHQPIVEQANTLNWLIDQIGRRDPEAQIDLISFSLGGIIASYWAADDENIISSHRDKIHSIVLINSPVGGIFAAQDIVDLGPSGLVWELIMRNIFGVDVLRELQIPGEDVEGSIVDSLEQAAHFPNFTSIQSSADFLVNGEQIVVNPFGPIPIGLGSQNWSVDHTRFHEQVLGGQDVDSVSIVQFQNRLLENHNEILHHPQTAQWVLEAIGQATQPIVAPEPTPTRSDFGLVVDGWRVIPVATIVREPSRGKQQVIVHLAFENLGGGAEIPTRAWCSRTCRDDIFKLTTSEGYVYEADVGLTSIKSQENPLIPIDYKLAWTGIYQVPPGFLYQGIRVPYGYLDVFGLNAFPAVGASGYQIQTPFGLLDATPVEVKFPTSRPDTDFLNAGDSFSIGDVKVTAVEIMRSNPTTIFVRWRLENSNRGYNRKVSFGVASLGDRGIFDRAANHAGGVLSTIGPSESKEVDTSLRVLPNEQNVKIILWDFDYEAENQPVPSSLGPESFVVFNGPDGDTSTPAVVPTSTPASPLVRFGLERETVSHLATGSGGIIYAATMENGIYKSTDSGETWTLIDNILPNQSNGLNINSIVVDPLAPNVVYVAIQNHGLYETTDGGESWRELTTGIDPAVAGNILSLGLSQDTPRFLLAGTYSSGIFRYQTDEMITSPQSEVQTTNGTTLADTPNTESPTSIDCTIPVGDSLFLQWQDQLGCPSGHPQVIEFGAEQPMQGGHLFWRRDTNEFYVIWDKNKLTGEDLLAGDWQAPPQRWNGTDACIVDQPAPDGTPPMVRGFSWWWCQHGGGPSGPLGWPLGEERGHENTFITQPFDNGFIWKGSGTKVYALLNDGEFLAYRP